MEKLEDFKIVLIGAGNLATNIGKALLRSGYRITQVYSRTEESARTLAELLNTKFSTSLSQLDSDATLYIVSLKDSVLAELLPQIVSGREHGMFIHTSGSVSINIWEGKAEHYGVLYPLQTFSKQREVSFREIPLFLEASTPKEYLLLETLAKRLSEKVYPASSKQRGYLHLSAVFACNFVNHMYAISEKIVQKHQFPFEVMLPLIEETARKIHHLSPTQAQTGPAIRQDWNIIDKHLKLLSEEVEIQDIYERISKHIHNL